MIIIEKSKIKQVSPVPEIGVENKRGERKQPDPKFIGLRRRRATARRRRSQASTFSLLTLLRLQQVILRNTSNI